jgi:hypothetical protein
MSSFSVFMADSSLLSQSVCLSLSLSLSELVSNEKSYLVQIHILSPGQLESNGWPSIIAWLA